MTRPNPPVVKGPTSPNKSPLGETMRDTNQTDVAGRLVIASASNGSLKPRTNLRSAEDSNNRRFPLSLTFASIASVLERYPDTGESGETYDKEASSL